MRLNTRVVASILTLGMTLTACGGGGGGSSSLLPSSTGTNPQGLAPTIKSIAAVPRGYGAFATQDLGQRAGGDTMKITVALKYNNQAQLDALVAAQSDPISANYHHYLSNAEFNAQFAPTPQQYDLVKNKLEAQGFTITHEYDNRTLIDAVAPAKSVESTFNTDIHTVSQGRFGQRYMNVKPATVPAGLGDVVKDVTLNNLVVMHRLSYNRGDRRAVSSKIHPREALKRSMNVHALAGSNLVTNPGFESGAVNNGWFQCGNVNAVVTTAHPHSGSYDERSGNTSGEVNGDMGVCQSVTIPSSGQLSFYAYQLSNESDTTYAYQEADLLDTYGNVVDNFYYSVSNTGSWVQKTVDLSAYAGGTYYLYFGVHGDGYGGLNTRQYIDDVSLTSGVVQTPTPAPTATPVPTPKPTATPVPTPKPTATPTPKPTATPTPKPTATPVSTPTPVPSATPVPTPTPGSGCTGSAALNGPLNGANGWLATGVAKAFDFPTQHGCNGAGQTVAVEIDTPIIASDVSTYLSAAGVTQTGSITNIAVDGGGNSTSADYVETALDVETIAGLAPGANIRVYNFPDLSSQSIEDGYNMTVSDGVASVVNSSFGGCETSDSAFTSTTNTIAQQAAAKGITFAASSGDSGSDECATSNNPPGVSAPSSDPYFTSVGSVDFTENSSGALTSITAANDSANGFKSGGGFSSVFPVPSYQSGIAGVNAGGRNNPDISLPGVGVAVYASGQGGWMKVDGTSWSSPEFSAYMSEVNQVHATHIGFVNPLLYSVFKTSGYADFTDVTSGTNGAYNAVTGYDLVTGIGAPKGWALANAL